jgi:hypothetical protein
MFFGRKFPFLLSVMLSNLSTSFLAELGCLFLQVSVIKGDFFSHFGWRVLYIVEREELPPFM